MAGKKTYEIEINGVKESITSVNELKKSQQDLEAAFNKASFGSENYKQLSTQLQDVNSRLKVIKTATDDITGADKVEGFVRFGTAIAGAFGTATLAAEAFGASGEDLEKINKKFGVLIGTLQTFQLVQQAIGRENKLFTSLVNKFTVATQAQTAATGQATIAQKIFNTIARANPIGLIITGITILIGLFALVANNIDFLKQKFEPFFKFVEEGFNKIVDVIRNVGSFLSGGLIDDAATAKTKRNLSEIGKAIEESQGKLTRIKELYDKQIELLTAIGGKEREIFKIRQALLIEEIRINQRLLKNAEARGLEEEKINEIKKRGFDLATDFQILQVNEQKRLQAEIKKAEEDRFNASKKANDDIIKDRERLKGKGLTVFDDKGARDSLEALERMRDQIKPIEVPLSVEAPDNFFETLGSQIEEIVESDEFKEISKRVGASLNAVDEMFDSSIRRQEEQLEFLRTEISETDKMLSDTNTKINETEQLLTNARGQRREYLIGQIDKERIKEKSLEEQKKAQVAEEKKRMKDIEKEKKRQAGIQRAIDLAQAAASTALAIIGFLKNPGGYPGIVLSVLAGITGAIQIAAISKTEKFAKGGILNGPSHANGGIITPYGELEGNEIVLTKGVTHNPILRSMASDINVAGGGRKFADGGTLTPDLSPIVNTTNQMTELINAVNKINSTPVQVSAVEVINTAGRVAEITSNATI